MRNTLIAILMLACFNMNLYADNCEHPQDDFDGFYCLNKIYLQTDKNLTKAYKKLRKSLRKKGKKVLKRSQLAWIQDRNDTCSLRQNGYFYVSLSCTTEMTRERTQFLRDRTTECRATGCQLSKLPY